MLARQFQVLSFCTKLLSSWKGLKSLSRGFITKNNFSMVQKSKQGESIETTKTVAGEIVRAFWNISKIDDEKPKDWRKHEKTIALFSHKELWYRLREPWAN